MSSWPSATSWPSANAWPSGSSWPASGLSGFTDLTTSSANTYFADTNKYTLTGSAPNQYYNKDPFARLCVSFPVATTACTLEAFTSSATHPFDQVDVWTSSDPTGATGLTHNQVVSFTSVGAKQQVAVTLPAGTRYVEFSEGARITGVSATSYTLIPAPVAVPRYLVAFGDSISVGNIAVPLALGYLSGGVRHSGPFGGVMPYGISGDSLFNQTGSGANNVAPVAANLVSRCSFGSVERYLYIEMGTNDYGLDLWSAASFAAVYGALVDAVHALDPTIKIYCQTLFHRNTPPNSGSGAESAQPVHGSTWADFNTAIAGVVAARPSFCFAIDGSTAFTLAEVIATGDGLHPGTTIHARMPSWLIAQLGFLTPVIASTSLITAVLTTDSPASIMAGSIKAGYIPENGLTSTSWADVTGGGLNMTGTCNVVSGLNGYNAAQGVAASSHKLSVNTTHPAPGTQPLVFWGVVRQDAWSNNLGVLVAGQKSGLLEILQHGSSPQICQFGTLGSLFGPANSGAPLGSYKVVEADFVGSTADTLIAGSVTVTGTLTNSGQAGNCIQIFSGNGTFASCVWQELWVFTAVPTSTQRSQLYSYATAKYATPSLIT